MSSSVDALLADRFSSTAERSSWFRDFDRGFRKARSRTRRAVSAQRERECAALFTKQNAERWGTLGWKELN